jgi:mannose-1-phosphate guanylyltransferase
MFDDLSLFQLTVDRNNNICSKHFVISSTDQYFLAVDQLEDLKKKELGNIRQMPKFLLEPVGRNTAPAIALACLALDTDDIVLVTPSDHLISNQVAYENLLNKAKILAEEGYLVTFGVSPQFAETGYGYIEADGVDVKAFHEKPDAETAQKYCDAGNFYWNSGIFCFKAGVFLEELEEYSPDIFTNAKMAFDNTKQDEMIKISYNDMINIPENSIDYAVMEKSKNVKVVHSDFGWSDLGSFDALDEVFPKGDDGNTLFDNGIYVDSNDNFVFASDARTIATVDVENLIIVDTPDALLISKKGSSQKVKKVVKELKIRKTGLHQIHLTVHRPWGTYTILEDSERYKIKRIVVKQGKRLSLQKHYHRSEHWIVVCGTAVVTIGGEEKLLRANESTYIPMGEVHRLENPGKIDLVLIEAQVGEFLGEDDIVRFEDDFSRC